MTTTKRNALNRIWTAAWRPVVGLIGLAALVIWSGGACESKVEPGQVATVVGWPVPAGAATYTVVREPGAARVDVIGTIESEQKVSLSARLSAYVQSVAVSAGDRVTNGQVLVTLDDREMREQLTQAEARLKQAETEFRRAEQLFAKAATTEQALTAAESQFTTARAAVEQARVMLGFTRITAPIAGVIADRRIEAGDLASPGQVMLTLYDPVRMRLEVPVPVRLVGRFALNQTVSITLDGQPAPVGGTVQEIVGEVDAQSRTQKVKVRLDPAAPPVLPGTFGRIWVAGEPRELVRIPATAVVRMGQLEMVQIVRDGRAVRRLVKTGPVDEGRVEILAGLEPGEVVLVTPVKEG